MGEWYWIGVCVGIGVAIGVALAGILGVSRAGLVGAVVAAAAAGALVGIALDDWDEALGGLLGGTAGGLGTAQLSRGTLRAGGTRGGTAALLAGAGIVLAAAAFVPVLGYLTAVAVPAVGLRLRRRAGRRYAGLRTLARD
jgi:hypothetical protein